MPNRPAIPAEIERDILIECGHRCAVCGTPVPLERAHIIPWHKSKEHKAEDLICMCANCHERADKEKWGVKTLREYKKRPWVMRQCDYGAIENVPVPRIKVNIEIDMGLNDFSEMYQKLLQSGLSGFLEILPDLAQVVRVEAGSVIVTVELPVSGAERLLSAYREKDPELFKFLAPLVILSIYAEMPGGEQIGLGRDPGTEMGLRKVEWKRFVRAPDAQLLDELYIPALSRAVRYDRCCAYFSSHILAVAARGFGGFIQNLLTYGDDLPRPAARLLVNEQLDPQDLDALLTTGDQSHLIRKLLKQFKTPQNALEENRLQMLAWLV
ncbi:MAG: HNH endonuclease, partial [Anaerolineae bacterium]|nr:HNH endonuclease [Anaerolineae bacterium]